MGDSSDEDAVCRTCPGPPPYFCMDKAAPIIAIFFLLLPSPLVPSQIPPKYPTAPKAKNAGGRKRVIGQGVRWGRGSGKSQADAIAGNLQTVSNGALGQAGAAEHADAAGLRHGQAVDHRD